MSNVNPNFPIPGLDQSSKGFRDNFTTIKTELENLQGTQIQLVGSVNSNVAVIGSGTNTIILETTGGIIGQTGPTGPAITGPTGPSFSPNGYTVATLPTGKPTGTIAYVTDATSPTYLGNLVGGGHTVCPAFFNGSYWVAG
jgi:hypothetical protein